MAGDGDVSGGGGDIGDGGFGKSESAKSTGDFGGGQEFGSAFDDRYDRGYPSLVDAAMASIKRFAKNYGPSLTVSLLSGGKINAFGRAAAKHATSETLDQVGLEGPFGRYGKAALTGAVGGFFSPAPGGTAFGAATGLVGQGISDLAGMIRDVDWGGRGPTASGFSNDSFSGVDPSKFGRDFGDDLTSTAPNPTDKNDWFIRSIRQKQEEFEKRMELYDKMRLAAAGGENGR